MDKEDLYAMDLHETIGNHHSRFNITRVPGGWIYDTWGETGEAGIAVFVPYHEEFNPDRQPG